MDVQTSLHDGATVTSSCGSCQRATDPGDAFCPGCGAPIGRAAVPAKRARQWLVLLGAAISLAGLVAVFLVISSTDRGTRAVDAAAPVTTAIPSTTTTPPSTTTTPPPTTTTVDPAVAHKQDVSVDALSLMLGSDDFFQAYSAALERHQAIYTEPGGTARYDAIAEDYRSWLSDELDRVGTLVPDTTGLKTAEGRDLSDRLHAAWSKVRTGHSLTFVGSMNQDNSTVTTGQLQLSEGWEALRQWRSGVLGVALPASSGDTTN
jgi:hypothetical protein